MDYLRLLGVGSDDIRVHQCEVGNEFLMCIMDLMDGCIWVWVRNSNLFLFSISFGFGFLHFFVLLS